MGATLSDRQQPKLPFECRHLIFLKWIHAESDTIITWKVMPVHQHMKIKLNRRKKRWNFCSHTKANCIRKKVMLYYCWTEKAVAAIATSIVELHQKKIVLFSDMFFLLGTDWSEQDNHSWNIWHATTTEKKKQKKMYLLHYNIKYLLLFNYHFFYFTELFEWLQHLKWQHQKNDNTNLFKTNVIQLQKTMISLHISSKW